MSSQDLVENALPDPLQESGLARLFQKMQAHDVAMITGWRKTLTDEQGERQLTRAENDQRNKELLAALLDAHYGVTHVNGNYIEGFGEPHAKEVGENSFFVVNLPNDPNFVQKLQQLGKHFNQDSVLIKPRGESAHLVGTNNAEFPGLGQKHMLPHFKAGSVPGPFLSRVRGRPFGFLDVKENYGSAAKYLINSTAKRLWEQVSVSAAR